MNISDAPKAERALARIGYYRLSGYWFPFRTHQIVAHPVTGKPYRAVQEQFLRGTDFQHATALYVFDKRLRLLFLDAIERIEVGIRVEMALTLGARGPLAHHDPAQLHPNFSVRLNPKTRRIDHQTWLNKLNDNEFRSGEDFMKRYRAKYNLPLPIWIAVELWDFGTMSHLLAGLTVADRLAIARKYSIPREDLLRTWVRSINHIRNVCAHHSRLWNRSPADQPAPPKPGEIPMLDHWATNASSQTKIYAVAAAIQYFLRTINPTTTWATRLRAHINTFPTAPGIVVKQMGFPANWETLPLWN